MAIGKSIGKKGKKGGKKKPVDPMTRKEWYDVVAPKVFSKRQCTKTFANKTVGNKVGADNLHHRVYEINLGDLMDEQSDYANRKVKLRVESIQGRSAVTQFHGMSLTRDRLCSLVRKWCTKIEAIVDVKTSDGYVLRVSVQAHTKRQDNQVKKKAFAKSSHVHRIRARMVRVVTRSIQKHPLMDVVKKLQLDVIGEGIQKSCSKVFPLRDCNVRKVKMLRTPKFDSSRLAEAHDDIPRSQEDIGVAAE